MTPAEVVEMSFTNKSSYESYKYMCCIITRIITLAELLIRLLGSNHSQHHYMAITRSHNAFMFLYTLQNYVENQVLKTSAISCTGFKIFPVQFWAKPKWLCYLL